MINNTQKQYPKNYKTIFGSLALALTLSTQLLSCTDQEVATAVGVGAIIGGAALIGSNRSCVSGYREVCHNTVDYWGYSRYECRTYWDRCAYTRPRRHDLVSNDFPMGNRQTELATAVGSLNAVNWGEHFKVNFEGSQKLLDAFILAQNGNTQALLDLGFKKQDLRRFALLKTPSDHGILAVSRTLDTDVKTVRSMMNELSKAAREHRQVIESQLKIKNDY
jgi:hypothetical protein